MFWFLVVEVGGEFVMYGFIVDDVDIVCVKLVEVVEYNDIVVIIGGVLVGDYDIMGDLVWEGNMEMLFNKVMMWLGSVMIVVVVSGKLLFVLFGNFGVCFVGFGLFVWFIICMM